MRFCISSTGMLCVCVKGQPAVCCLLLALSMLLYMYESKRLCMYVCVCVHSERMFVAVGMLQALFSLKA